MTATPAPPRLLALRVQGFKSFAERTNVEFGGGISAVVGPNGSGKSNLADALRWALGEQGRALRSRKAEDVIWAGSEKRTAQGMADVTLVLDNGDALLPVDFQVLEFGRRLYRSGENEYLLNKQRIRLRDLVDLLDAAHLADNAFLFIGQGMVDQALALRPEERRPLFEEVAGVRRHERRRRKAEEQLAESEANLARVEDILAELRPQARRLAQQAEQQATRETAGDDLAAALLVAAHARWHDAARRRDTAASAVGSARAAVDSALAGLLAAEAEAAAIAASLATRAEGAAARRAAAEDARSALTTLQLAAARLDAEIESVRRERVRHREDRVAAEEDLARQHRILSEPSAPRDHALEADLTEAERVLAEALAELATLRAASRARDADLAAVRRAEAARQAELETARRRVADAERAAEAEETRASEARAAHELAVAAAEEARAALARAAAEETAARAVRETAARELERLEAEGKAAGDAASAASAAHATVAGRRDAALAAVAESDRGALAAAARRRGSRRLDEELVVDPELRSAIDAALGAAARAYVVGPETAAEIALPGSRGTLVIAGGDRRAEADRGAVAAFLGEVAASGGGALATAVRKDPSGAASRLLSRVAWLPDLEGCRRLQAVLPAGWILVPRDGSAVVGESVITLGRVDGALERQAQLERLTSEAARLEAKAVASATAAEAARGAVAAARAALATAREAEARASSARARAEEGERATARAAETSARESGWHAAQAERLAAELARLRAAASAAAGNDGLQPSSGIGTGQDDGGAIATWEARAAALRERRDRLASQVAGAEASRREAERRRAQAEAAVELDLARIAGAETVDERLGERERQLAAEADRVREELASAVVRDTAARAELEELLSEDAAERARLADAERAAATAREQLRSAVERARLAERSDLEARLVVDNLREQLLVELAGLGELGLRHLAAVGGRAGAAVERGASAEPAGDGDAETAALERALDDADALWSATPAPADVPSPGRLAALRRRYHELGAANPYAADEYAVVRARLDGLEAQRADLRAAIDRTRALAAELDSLITDAFRTTFRALEARFDARFQQLFGGGFARLSLTDPGDLSATGVEIVARPPGKKPQALAMLSGGERALTAVALLFAMLEVRPVPFCVLDEVDAALDEANIGRFTAALRELAARTQFIVITHNRGTIETADALYGVTVGDDSVSRVISLRLDEATEIAERAAASAGGRVGIAVRAG